MLVSELVAKHGRKVVTARVNEPVATVANRMVGARIGAVMVYSADGTEIVGLLSERDLMRSIAEYPYELAELPIGQYATTSLRTCTPDDRAESVLRTMLGQGFRHMPVVRQSVRDDGKEETELLAVLSIKDLAIGLLTEPA